MAPDLLLPKEKTTLFELFSNIFAVEPTIELLELFQIKENKALYNSYGIDPFSDIRDRPVREQAELLAIEYARLFLTPPKLVPLYESLYMQEKGLWGPSTAQVNKIYNRFGFKLDEGFKDAPDHLSAELSFLAMLSGLESEYREKALEAAERGVLEVKKHFLKNHILKWFGPFKKDLEKHARFVYYKEIARLTGMILEEEWKSLKGVKEV